MNIDELNNKEWIRFAKKISKKTSIKIDIVFMAIKMLSGEKIETEISDFTNVSNELCFKNKAFDVYSGDWIDK